MTERAYRLTLLLLALLLAASAPAMAAEDEIVPDGVLLLRAGIGHDRLDRAIGRSNTEGGLETWLIPDAGARTRMQGSASRDVTRFDLRLHYGLSDTWNLALLVPYLRIDQRSTLAPAPGETDPGIQAIAERFGDRTVSGVGDVRLLSLHRTVYSDRNGLVIGYGFQVPAGDPQSDYVGEPTLSTRGPAPRALALLHYTRYPVVERSRFDLRAEVAIGMHAKVDTPDEGRATANPGNSVSLLTGWEQEFGPVLTGIALLHRRQGANEIAAKNLADPVQETAYRLTLGYGNLTALERAPLAFPYVVTLQYEKTWGGFNVPLRNELTLSLQTYF